MSRPLRTALITGAGNGIGRGIARQLAGPGTELILVDLQEDSLEATKAMCGTAAAVTLHQSDVTDVVSTEQVFQGIDATAGRLDILVNCAARVADTFVGETERAAWQVILETNLTAPFFWSQAAVPLMRRTGFGRIVNISSHAARKGTLGRSGYGAAKAGLEALTRTMAVELAPFGITVNAVAPGVIETDRTRMSHGETRRSAWEKAVPMKRYGSPADVAEIVAFLCREEAGYVTGETIRVDGGFGVAGLMPDR